MKIKSGIPGMDELLNGGFNENSSILVMGAPGTGKSIFAIQFLYGGCKNKEAGLYITCEEDADAVRSYSKNLGLDFSEFEKRGLAKIIKEDISVRKPLSIARPLEIIKSNNIKRVVLDSLTLFEYASSNETEFRKSLLEFLSAMKSAKVTLLVVSQEGMQSIDLLRYRPQDFLFDGLVLLTKIRKGSSFERCVNVVKMRGQEHVIDIVPFTIEKNGIVVHTKEIPFSLK
jgi:KaiC/GvpD/RAD55 family RecA-like ATPase